MSRFRCLTVSNQWTVGIIFGLLFSQYYQSVLCVCPVPETIINNPERGGQDVSQKYIIFVCLLIIIILHIYINNNCRLFQGM
jgi:hypothetical protein